ncbi:MAG: hypothetical protein JO223_16185 [Hyphomicrobiales bacterium]|nr:hypothetical protein [Hyphomicrobiales bacterium]MBV8439242.1 hypothetical protein [Hyphomicrobiales bacterium]
MLYVLEADPGLDEHVAFALRKLAQDHGDIPIALLKEVVRAQFFALQLDGEKGLRVLPALVPSPEERQVTRAWPRRSAPPARQSPETRLRLKTVFDLSGVRDVAADRDTIAGPGAEAGGCTCAPVTHAS